jgi:PAS domain S-box-containing protein
VAHSSRIVRGEDPVGLRGILVDITDQRRIESDLRASEARYKAIFEHTSNASVLVEEDGTVSLANSQWHRLTGCSPEEGRLPWLDFVHSEDRQAMGRYLADQRTGSGRTPGDLEFRLVTRGGEVRAMIATVSRIPGSRTCFATLLDVTERKRAEEDRATLQERLRQAEKLEAIGLLAGGVAHDFNNHLSVISGFAEILEGSLEDPGLRHFAQNIVKSCDCVAELTRQLLAFARKGQFLQVPVDIHHMIQDVVELLQHSIDKRISIETRLAAESCIILGDPAQIQSAFMNLALNARDAMPGAGHLTFATRRVFLDEDYCRHQPYRSEPGHYLCVSVEDSGTGMDAATLSRIFDPFFTTKELGKGTGLGLASVYGTVKHHNGAIHVYSEVGRGTCFKVYLPLPQEAPPVGDPLRRAPAWEAPCKILLVDDERLVVEMARAMLRSLGHEVDVCHDGLEAVERYRASWPSYHLVVLDLVMPGSGGRETFRALRAINPEARILIASGFSVEGEAQELLDQGARAFLQKPFLRAELAAAIGSAMEGAALPQGGVPPSASRLQADT